MSKSEKAIETRKQVIDYIRNSRDTVVKKWMALEERIKAEDRDRENFFVKKAESETRSLPLVIIKFIRTLKRAVRNIMRDKGGTPYSIIRNLFLYWDSQSTGSLSASDLTKALRSLSVVITDADTSEIVKFYGKDGHKDSMTYDKLLSDIQIGEPAVFQPQPSERETDEERALRFQTHADKFAKRPQVVVDFLQAVRAIILKKMTYEGGTPYSHVRYAFLMYDWNYSNALDRDELVRAVRQNLCLHITDEQATAIIDHYDRKSIGEMDYDLFLQDICEGLDALFTFTELTPRSLAFEKKTLATNVFIPVPFRAPPNKTLEMFKRKVKLALIEKIQQQGGSMKSWIKTAFDLWDTKGLGKVFHWQHLQGACRRFGFILTEEEAKTIMTSYDKQKNGEVEYFRIVEDLLDDDPHFMADAVSVSKAIIGKTATARAPPGVASSIRKLKRAVEVFPRHSKGVISAKDVMYGTFLRYDKAHTGRVSVDALNEILKEFRLDALTERDANDLVVWFDTNGSRSMDYNELTRQVFGGDVLTRAISLPAIHTREFGKSTGSSSFSPGKVTSTAAHDSMMLTQLPINQQKNMKVFESRARKMMMKEMRKKTIIAEKSLLEGKLAEIEKQKKVIMEKYHSRKHQLPAHMSSGGLHGTSEKSV